MTPQATVGDTARAQTAWERWWPVLAIAGLGFVLRLAHVLGMRANPHFDAPIMDPAYHVEWARALAAGRTFQEGPYFRAPLYPWFLGFLFELFGDSMLAPRVVQCLLGTLSTILVYLVGERAVSRRVGLVAEVVVATYWVLIYFDGELLIPTLFVPLELWALWCTLGLARVARPRSAVFAGLAWGLAAIARPNVLLFLPFLALWLLLRRSGGRPSWRPALALCAGVLVPILPITLRNATFGNDPVFISSQGGVNFWIGNNPDSDGSTAIVPGTRGGWWEGYHDAIAQAEAAEGRELRASEVSRHYFGRALEWMRAEPAAAQRLLGWKLRLFWTDWELGNNQEIRFFAFHFSPWMRWLPLGFAALSALALVGFGLMLRDGRLFPLTGFALAYTASVVLFFVCSRFRVPVLPVFAVFAAHAVCWLADRLREHAFVPAAAALVVAGASAWVSRAYPEGLRRSDANGYLQLAQAEWRRSDPELALDYIRRALEADPRNVFAHTTYGRLLAEREEWPAAEAELEAALALDPGKPDALDSLLDLFLRTGRNELAESRALAARDTTPYLAVPAYHLGRLRANAGRLQDARELFDEATRKDPHDFRFAYSLGMVEQALGNGAAALAAFDAARANIDQATEPFLSETYVRAISLRIASGDRRGACDLVGEMERRFPGDPRIAPLRARACD